MSAYIIARVNVTNPTQYENYKALTPDAIAAYGGKFLVRGGETVSLEGQPEEHRIIILEFENLEQAQKFYHSDEYAAARSLREGAADCQFIAVDGI